MATALLLIAHGSRHAAANLDLHHAAAALRGEPGIDHVEAAFLELSEPDIPEGARRCVAAGARRVVLVPYFLSAGVHVRDDLERWRAELAGTHAGVEFVLAEPLGRHPLLLDVVRARIRAALGEAKRSN